MCKFIRQNLRRACDSSFIWISMVFSFLHILRIILYSVYNKYTNFVVQCPIVIQPGGDIKHCTIQSSAVLAGCGGWLLVIRLWCVVIWWWSKLWVSLMWDSLMENCAFCWLKVIICFNSVPSAISCVQFTGVSKYVVVANAGRHCIPVIVCPHWMCIPVHRHLTCLPDTYDTIRYDRRV